MGFDKNLGCYQESRGRNTEFIRPSVRSHPQTTARDNNNASFNCCRPSMSFDNLCKLLFEKYPESFASWVLDSPQTTVKVLKTELSNKLP
ncbi:MAG: hypothetical protein KME40_23850 [Komarekiella atlantica HA4396-MV6]|nr:hypothetical protein [Komarekiella atlantica HA4396-MV6]